MSSSSSSSVSSSTTRARSGENWGEYEPKRRVGIGTISPSRTLNVPVAIGKVVSGNVKAQKIKASQAGDSLGRRVVSLPPRKLNTDVLQNQRY